nr:reverse transcriptase domain-containing protein [Tanacetum cinerariifolium]
MEELCQPSLNGRGGPIASIAIQATNFRLKNDMIQQSIKVNGVTDYALRLYLFPHSLTHHATAWFDNLPRNSINTFEQMAKMFLGKYFPSFMVTKLRNEITNFCQRLDESLFEAWERYKLSIDRCGTFMKRRPEEFFDLIENMTAHHNDWDTSAQQSESSSSITSSSDPKIIALKAEMAEINKNLMKVLRINHQVKAVTPSCKTCGGPHSYNDCPATVGQTQNVYDAGAYQGGNSYQPQGNNHPQGNNQERNQFFQGASHGQNPPQAYQAPAYQASSYQALVHQPPIPQSNTITNPKEDLKGINTQSGTAYQGPTIPTTSFSLPQVVERETEATKDTEPPTNNESTKDPVVAPVSAPKPNPKPSIPYPSRFHDQKLRDKANDQKENFFQIFQDINFNISFADALILMPKFRRTIKTLLTNKDKLHELARTPLNEHCSADLLKKLPEKLGDPGKVAKYVFVKVGTFHFPTDFVVVDLDVDPRIPLILERSFLKIEKALIDVYEGELTLREVLGFSDVIASGNPTPYYDPIISTSSLTLTPFGDRDFLLEEVDSFLALEDEPTSPKVNHSYYDTEGDILLLEAFLNNDPSLPPLTQGKYLPQIQKELKFCEAKNDKSSIDEPPEVELKDIPPYLEYAFLEGDDKFLVIIVKDLKDVEKTTLTKVLKSHNFSGYFQIPIDPKDRENTTFTSPYGTFAYRRMPFGLCNAPGTFQRYIMAIFHDMIEKRWKSSWTTSRSLGIHLELVSPIWKRC